MLDLSALLAPTWVDSVGLGRPLAFGCVPLAPADFHEHAEALASFITAAATAVEDGEDGARMPNRAEIQHMQVIAVLTVRSVRDVDEDGAGQPFTFVLSESQEDAASARVWIGRLPVTEVAAIAGSGISRAMDAVRRAAGFREERTVATHDRRDGEAIRDNAGAASGAA